MSREPAGDLEDDVVIQRIESWYGAAIPSDLERLAIWYGGNEARSDAFARRFGRHLSIPASLFGSDGAASVDELLPTYHTDPVELLPVFGAYDRFGYLDLAPELRSPECLPVVCSEPNSYDLPVYSAGTSLADSLAYVATTDPELASPGLHEVFGFPIRPRFPTAFIRDVYPTVFPTDYRYVASGPTDGVLAPHDAFDGAAPVTISDDARNIESALKRAERALAAGYPATTVLIARHYRRSFPMLDRIEVDDLSHAMTLWAQAAIALGRPSHARIVTALRDAPDSFG